MKWQAVSVCMHLQPALSGEDAGGALCVHIKFSAGETQKDVICKCSSRVFGDTVGESLLNENAQGSLQWKI